MDNKTKQMNELSILSHCLFGFTTKTRSEVFIDEFISIYGYDIRNPTRKREFVQGRFFIFNYLMNNIENPSLRKIGSNFKTILGNYFSHDKVLYGIRKYKILIDPVFGDKELTVKFKEIEKSLDLLEIKNF